MNKLLKSFRNLPGWRTSRRIIVFESDDWGSIRMPSLDAFARLKELKIDLESNDYSRYNLNDTLADKDDFTSLYEVLGSVEDTNGNPAAFTALSVVANPDFGKIRENGFSQYCFEPFTETLERYYPGHDVFGLWREGIDKGLFIPQFHGREHLNVTAWMNALRNGDKKARAAFDEGMWGYVPERANGSPVEFQAAFQMTAASDIQVHKEIISSGLDLFHDLFGYRAAYFVPPNGPINNSLNVTLAEKGISYRSSSKIQKESAGLGKDRTRIHWLGQKDKSGIIYITRNCFFEPSCQGESYSVGACLKNIENAFAWNKPAVVSSHRVNYTGHLNPGNRETGLRELRRLLEMIVKKWPDAEFMTTDRLGKLISEDGTGN